MHCLETETTYWNGTAGSIGAALPLVRLYCDAEWYCATLAALFPTTTAATTTTTTATTTTATSSAAVTACDTHVLQGGPYGKTLFHSLVVNATTAWDGVQEGQVDVVHGMQCRMHKRLGVVCVGGERINIWVLVGELGCRCIKCFLENIGVVGVVWRGGTVHHKLMFYIHCTQCEKHDIVMERSSGGRSDGR
jgi:hypothetical protein